MATDFSAYDPTQLPTLIVDYLDARDEDRYADARALFAPDATVVDDGRTYRGIGEIGAWITESSSEYDYTATRIGQSVDDDARLTVQIRLDGNFPGGTVTLRYQFELSNDRIGHLTIEA